MTLSPRKWARVEMTARDMLLLRLRRRGLTLRQIGEAFHLSSAYVGERVKTAQRLALVRAAQHGADISAFQLVTRRKGPVGTQPARREVQAR